MHIYTFLHLEVKNTDLYLALSSFHCKKINLYLRWIIARGL